MKAHWAYLVYVLRHKWFVFIECCKLGISWLGIIHDLSKISRDEWTPYVHSFYNPDGSKRVVRDATGYYDPTKVSPEFDYAWLHHQNLNKHHWQYWMLVQDEDEDKILEIPDIYRKEMLADWRGAGRAQGKLNTKAWYEKNGGKMKLHPRTRMLIEMEIGII